MAERPDHAEAMAAGSPESGEAPADWLGRMTIDEIEALRRLYDVARRRYGRDVALDMALDAVEEARR